MGLAGARETRIGDGGRDHAGADEMPLDRSVLRPAVVGQTCPPAVAEDAPLVDADRGGADRERLVVGSSGFVEEEEVHRM
jgi:hypothetical protein